MSCSPPASTSNIDPSITNTTRTHSNIPVPVASSNSSQTSFTYPKTPNDAFDDLPSEVADADVSIANDGSFVETSSGLAAHYLKKWYDRQLGVDGKDIRSPYVVTGIVNQHGKQMYRVGNKLMMAPAKAAEDASEKVTLASSSMTSASASSSFVGPQTSPPSSYHPDSLSAASTSSGKRRSRLSQQFHSILPKSFTSSAASSSSTQPVSDLPTERERKRSSPVAPYNLTSRETSGPSSQSTPQPPTTSPPVRNIPTPAFSSADMDVFGITMGWLHLQSETNGTSKSAHTKSADSKRVLRSSQRRLTANPHRPSIPQFLAMPFGEGVTFDSPIPAPSQSSSRAPSSPSSPVLQPIDISFGEFDTKFRDDLLKPQVAMEHSLREMQSFESVMTAKAGGSNKDRTSKILSSDASSTLAPSTVLEQDDSDQGHNRSSGAHHTPKISSSQIADECAYDGPAPATLQHSRYSTEIFRVLQTSRGLPQISQNTDNDADEGLFLSASVIKMSAQEEHVEPRNDPRFVLWGDVRTLEDYTADDSTNGTSSTSGSMSGSISLRGSRSGKRKSSLASAHSSSAHSSFSMHHSSSSSVESDSASAPPTKRTLLAGSVERWIAQFTSARDPAELLTFFLTYRTYIAPIDLCHLLIARFHWTLEIPIAESDDEEHDEKTVRVIIRTRTFSAFKYWLVTFFAFDFLPNRELRRTLGNWLNALKHDPILQRHPDGVATVKKLIKTAKECKAKYCRPPLAEVISDNESGSSDIDLDFDSEALTRHAPNNKGPANMHLAASMSSGGDPSAAAMQQLPLHGMMLGDVSGVSSLHSPANLGEYRSALSKAVERTMGKLGRWTRTIQYNSRRDTLQPHLDVYPNAEGDMLAVKGGLGEFLKFQGANSKLPTSYVTPPSLPDLGQEPTPAQVILVSPVSPEINPRELSRPPGLGDSVTFANDEDVVKSPLPPIASPNTPKVFEQKEKPSEPRASIASVATESSYGELLERKSVLPSSSSPLPGQLPQKYDIVSIDDYDLSDDSSSYIPPPPKPARRLPTRREMEQRPVESIASMEFIANSFTAYDGEKGAKPTATNGDSKLAGHKTVLGPGYSFWQLNAMLDNISDDEDGDRDNALRTLEGKINQDKRLEKRQKMDTWAEGIAKRMATGNFNRNERPRFSTYYPMDPEGSSDGEPPSDEEKPEDDGEEEAELDAAAPVAEEEGPSQSSDSVPSTSSTKSEAAPATTKAPAIEDAVPAEILAGRIRPGEPPERTIGPRFQSWIMRYQAEDIAKHLAMIDRELFMQVKFEELVMDNWYEAGKSQVLDWALFYKGQQRSKVQTGQPTNALSVLRGRFNIVAAFTVSEIVCTPPNRRLAVYRRFLKIAWMSWEIHNYHSSVAIINGLQSAYVMKSMTPIRARIPQNEQHNAHILKALVSSNNDFGNIRKAVRAASMMKSHMNGSNGAPGERQRKDDQYNGCVPFIGLYLSQLHRYNQLPDVVDPTSPHEAVLCDDDGLFTGPVHPEVFSSLAPLPAIMQVEPLINVQKQRLIADVVKVLVGGQQLANDLVYTVDRHLFTTCIKLKAMDDDSLRKALNYPWR